MGKQMIKTDLNYEQLAEAFQIELENVVLLYKVINNDIDLGIFESVKQLRSQCYNPPKVIDEQMEALNGLIEGFGIEALTNENFWHSHYWQDTYGLYVNQGESYALTIVYNVIDDIFEFTSMGDFVESMENQLQSESDENNL